MNKKKIKQFLLGQLDNLGILMPLWGKRKSLEINGELKFAIQQSFLKSKLILLRNYIKITMAKKSL